MKVEHASEIKMQQHGNDSESTPGFPTAKANS